MIGLAVAHIQDDGLLPVHRLGGWRASVAYGQRVEVRTAQGTVHGVIARRTKDDEKVEWDRALRRHRRQGRRRRARLVAPGDPIVVGRAAARARERPRRLAQPRQPAGVYVALESLRRLAAEDGRVPTSPSSRALRRSSATPGAGRRSFAPEPDARVALDVTYATDVPGGDPNEAGDHRLGSGPAIFRGPRHHAEVLDLLAAAAEAEGIAHTFETG